MSAHFTPREFRCKCGACRYSLVDPPIDKDFLEKLEELRHKLGDHPMMIVSGYRCVTHNEAVDGAKDSQHMKLPVRCADVVVKGLAPHEVADAAEPLFNGLGRYPGWVHVDTRPERSRW